MLLNDPAILDRHVRAHAGVNALEGVGMAEAPRGTLIHHYKVNEDGAITWANLIIATGNNNLAIGRSIKQVSRHFVDGKRLQDGMLNRVQAVLRAYDPCLSCSTHATGQYPVEIQLVGYRRRRCWIQCGTDQVARRSHRPRHGRGDDLRQTVPQRERVRADGDQPGARRPAVEGPSQAKQCAAGRRCAPAPSVPRRAAVR